MVAHTGNLSATIKALEVVDGVLGQVVDFALKRNFVVFITSDHGNAEVLASLRTGEIDKEHNISPVPFIIATPSPSEAEPQSSVLDLNSMTPTGVLSDVAPTILKVMGIKKPKEMTGISLI